MTLDSQEVVQHHFLSQHPHWYLNTSFIYLMMILSLLMRNGGAGHVEMINQTADEISQLNSSCFTARSNAHSSLDCGLTSHLHRFNRSAPDNEADKDFPEAAAAPYQQKLA